MFQRLDHALPAPAQKERHQKVEIFVAVRGEDEGRKTGGGDADAQFFLQFTDQANLRRLAGLELAAGKFPQARQRLAPRPLADQHASVAVDQGRGGDQKKGLAQLR